MILRNVPWDPVSQGTSVHPPNMRPEQYLQSGTTPSEVNTGNACLYMQNGRKKLKKLRNVIQGRHVFTGFKFSSLSKMPIVLL